MKAHKKQDVFSDQERLTEKDEAFLSFSSEDRYLEGTAILKHESYAFRTPSELSQLSETFIGLDATPEDALPDDYQNGSGGTGGALTGELTDAGETQDLTTGDLVGGGLMGGATGGDFMGGGKGPAIDVPSVMAQPVNFSDFNAEETEHYGSAEETEKFLAEKVKLESIVIPPSSQS